MKQEEKKKSKEPEETNAKMNSADKTIEGEKTVQDNIEQENKMDIVPSTDKPTDNSLTKATKEANQPEKDILQTKNNDNKDDKDDDPAQKQKDPKDDTPMQE